MSGSTTTFIPGATPTVVLPASPLMKLPTTPSKPPQKSRIKNTPRRGKLPGMPLHLNSQQTLFTQANRNAPSVVSSLAGPAPTSAAVPVILNSQPCNVNTPSAVSSTVPTSGAIPVILNSQPCNLNTPSAVSTVPTSGTVPVILNSQSCNMDTPNAVTSVAGTPGAVPVIINSQPCNVLLVSEATPNFSQANFISQVSKSQKLVYANAVYTTANSKSAEVKPENSAFQTKPKPISVRPKLVVHKNKPVLPKGLETPANFVIPNQTLTFPVETPTSVGYSINITDILPQNQLTSPAKLKPVQQLNAQLLSEDPILVKSEAKMGAPMNSYFQFQGTGDADDIPAVIPITIVGPNQQQLAIDSSNAHFFSQPLPQLMPFQTLAPTQSPPKLDKLPQGMEDATVGPVHVVDVINVPQGESVVRAAGNGVTEIHHGLTKSVPEPYAADILSQLTSDGSLPAITCSQVSSVLSALDAPAPAPAPTPAPEPEAILPDQPQPPPPPPPPQQPPSPPKGPPPSRKSNRKPESRQKHKEEEKSNEANKLVERVQCFKCRFCLFLTLDKEAVTKHIEQEHSSHLSKTKKNSDVIPCPGCSNVFVSEKSFSVHLSEDHKVAVRELNDILSTLIGSREQSEEESSKKKKVKKSAKIRVRNLMKDETPEEPPREPPEELPRFETPAQEEKPQHDIEDHDYATTFHDSEDSGNESGRKRGRRRKKGLPRKKRKANTENEDEEMFLQSGYKCNVSFCVVRMTSHDNLVYHQRCHKKKEAKTPADETEKKGQVAEAKSRKMEYVCPECSKLIKSWVQMSGHLWRSHGIDMELHACDQCEYKTPSLANMVNLHQRIHGSERPFPCDACDKTFKTTKQLRNHKVLHANKMKAAAGEASACDECGRCFIDNRLLRSHISAVHKKEKPFNCPTCGYSASNRSTLKMHLRLHTGEKPFKCEQCSYSTADHNSLRRHKKRHTGDKPYKCPYCFYACIQSSTYKVHLRTKHSGQGEGLMFSCERCPFYTVSQDMYKSHAAQHKGPDEETNSGSEARRRRSLTLDSDEDSSAVATAAVSQPLPIILSFSTDDALATEAPNMHDVVEEVSEAIIPGSDLHLLYSNFSGLSSQQSTDATANIYGSQSEFVMMMGDSVIQVVEEQDPDSTGTLVAIAEERITGDLGEIQENDEDLKFKLCDEVRS